MTPKSDKIAKIYKKSQFETHACFLMFSDTFFMVSDILKPLILMTPTMVFKVFLSCRRSPLEVDSASQKSSKIGLKSHKSRKKSFWGRLEKYMIFRSIF
jgi:hypothetical protein